ncbi:PBSX family phage terminase large subunit, partial [Xanthomonas citri pv. citri]|nr:PBSX family phage terminase large subunit [Xanthomonas citri pv. citri]
MSWSLFWYAPGDVYFKIKEYFYDARSERVQKTDGQFYEIFLQWLGDYASRVQTVYVDPSATSWIAQLQSEGRFNVQKAANDVLNG